MPLKLIPPRQGKTQNWYVRGTYLRVTLDHSTGTPERRTASKILAKWKAEIEAGEFTPRAAAPASFLSAAVAYMQAGGERVYIEPILAEWGEMSLVNIDQALIDATAEKLYPGYPSSTKNRQFYTPVSAVLKHVGIDKKIKRPKGWRGTKRTFWIEPAATFKLLEHAAAIDAEFGIFCTLLNYTGLRISEALDEMVCERVDLHREFAYIGDTKTDEPRAVYLPPVVVAALANHPRGLSRKGRLFRFHDGGRLRDMLKDACKRAGISLPRRTAFHVFRHNYGTWMRLYGGLDGLGLTRTGVWADMDSVDRYSHSEPTAEARRAALLPTPTRGETVEKDRKAG